MGVPAVICFTRPQGHIRQTRCRAFRMPCHDQPVYLVQRGHDSGPLSWSGVPCIICGATATVENNEDRSSWAPCEDVHPRLETMHCWCLP